MNPINLDDVTQQDNHFVEKDLISKPEENGIIDYHDTLRKTATTIQPDKFALRKFSEFYILPPFSFAREPVTKYAVITSPSIITFQSIPNRLNGELSLLATIGKYLNVIYPANLGGSGGYVLAGGGGEFKHTFNMSPTSERLTLIATMFVELPEHVNDIEVYKFEGAGEKGVRCKVSLNATSYTTDGMFTTSIEQSNDYFLKKGIYGNTYNRNPVIVMSMLLLKNTETIEFGIDFNFICYVSEDPSGDVINNTYSMIDFRSHSSNVPQGCVLPGLIHPCIGKPKPGGIKITKIKCELFENYQHMAQNEHITN